MVRSKKLKKGYFLTKLLLYIVLCLLLAACGSKGDLRLPEEKAESKKNKVTINSRFIEETEAPQVFTINLPLELSGL